MPLTYHLKQNKNKLLLTFDKDQLATTPVKTAMKTISIIENNNRSIGFFVEFDPNTQNYIKTNKEHYNSLTSSENPLFKKFSTPIFNELLGGMYLDGEEVSSNVQKIYNLESKISQISLPDDIPHINWALTPDTEHVHKSTLEIENLDSLIAKFGAPLVLNFAVLFKDSLNHSYQLKNKTKETPYGLSVDIKRKCFDEATQTHPIIPRFESKLYFIDQFLNSACEKIEDPNQIIELLFIKQEVVNMINPLVPKSKKKQTI